MMTNISLRLTASIVLSLALLAADKTQPLNLRLGLWQMTYTMDRSGVVSIPAELLAKLTPEQRARTEARLKARAAQGPHVVIKRFCLTQEKLDKAVFEESDNQSCQRTIVASSSKSLQFRQECVAADAKRSIEGRMEALDPETVKGSLKANLGGGNSPSTTDLLGKWIAADCGDAYSKR
jgi:hypothetical protein